MQSVRNENYNTFPVPPNSLVFHIWSDSCARAISLKILSSAFCLNCINYFGPEMSAITASVQWKQLVKPSKILLFHSVKSGKAHTHTHIQSAEHFASNANEFLNGISWKKSYGLSLIHI